MAGSRFFGGQMRCGISIDAGKTGFMFGTTQSMILNTLDRAC
jgi:hypothetical protein